MTNRNLTQIPVCLFFLSHTPLIKEQSATDTQTSLVAQTVKHLPTMWETRVQSLGQEDPMEKEMATHSSILAWKIPWMEEPDRLYSPWGHKESDMTERLHSFTMCKTHSVQLRRSVMSDSLRPHESQHARPPCPSPTPGVHSDSRPSSQ